MFACLPEQSLLPFGSRVQKHLNPLGTLVHVIAKMGPARLLLLVCSPVDGLSCCACVLDDGEGQGPKGEACWVIPFAVRRKFLLCLNSERLRQSTLVLPAQEYVTFDIRLRLKFQIQIQIPNSRVSGVGATEVDTWRKHHYSLAWQAHSPRQGRPGGGAEYLSWGISCMHDSGTSLLRLGARAAQNRRHDDGGAAEAWAACQKTLAFLQSCKPEGTDVQSLRRGPTTLWQREVLANYCSVISGHHGPNGLGSQERFCSCAESHSCVKRMGIT